MAVTGRAFGNGVAHIVNNNVKWGDATQTFNLSFHTATMAPNIDTWDFFDDATNEVAAGSGYTAGGVAIPTRSVTVDTTNHRVQLLAGAITVPFTGAKTWRYGVVRRARGGLASADELVALLTWDADQTVSTSYTLTPDPTGLIRFPY